MRKIVLCFDGTWNTPDDNDEDRDEIKKNAETNVIKIYRSILGEDKSVVRNGTPSGNPGITTLKWYDKGVGTRWYEHIRGGAFGFGLSQNIREGYKFLIDQFEPGDQIYLFGFSRGAYTARSLVGLIRNAGLLKSQYAPDANPDDNPILMDAYQLYRNRDGSADTPFAQVFRKKHSHESVSIKFVGVWDTVGALGIPLNIAKRFNSEQYGFHDLELSGIVENAFHAIAVDEHREDYQAALWNPKMKFNQTMEQVWFVGAHADVGGGYPDQMLSDITIAWMQDKAKLAEAGLELDPARVPKVEPDEVIKGKVTDSFGTFLLGLYKIFRREYYRQIMQTSFGAESLHDTVTTKRQKDLSYKPKNPGLV